MSSNNNPRRRSIVTRTATALTIVVTVAWGIAVIGTLFVLQDELAESFDGSLQQTAERIVDIIDLKMLDRTRLQSVDAFDKRESRHEYLSFQARSPSGDILFRSARSPETPFDAPLKTGFFDTAKARIYTAQTLDGDMYIQVADYFSHRREALRESGGALIYPLLLLIPITIFATVLVARRNLSPLLRLGKEISEKDRGNLEPLDDRDLPVELEPITRSLNSLLTRLKAALQAERMFSSNSAHELRTPIAGLSAQVARLLAIAPDDLKPRLETINRSLRDLGRMVEKLLQLSRAEAGVGLAERPCNLADIIRLVADDLGRSPLGMDRIVLDLADPQGVEKNVDPDAFGIVMRNLLENALLHSPAQSPIEVTAAAEETGDSIRVRNGGAAVTKSVLETITGRFVRGDTSASGSGLGLSIATMLAEHMGAELVFNSPIPGSSEGFEAVLTFPKTMTSTA